MVNEPSHAQKTALFSKRLVGAVSAGATSQPLVSSLNYRAGQTRANNAVVPLGVAGDITVVSGQPSGTVHFVLDINGYFE